MLDAGCGEGVLVDEYASRLNIQGLDLNYTSERVRHGSVTDLPYKDGSFAYALCLDVLEHLTFEDQPKAFRELQRVLQPGGELLVSVPNLAHLQSRVHFLLQGRLIRTAAEQKHPGDRPVVEYIALAQRAGFGTDWPTWHFSNGANSHALDTKASACAAPSPPRPDAHAPGCRMVPGEPAHVSQGLNS